MLRIPPHYRLPIGISVFLHVILLIALAINLPRQDMYRMNNQNKSVKIINAVAVNQTAVDNEIKKIKQKQEQKNKAKLAQERKLQQQALALKKQQMAERKREAVMHAEQLRLKEEKERKAREKAMALKKQKEKQKQLAAKQQQLQKKLLQQEMLQEQTAIKKAQQVAQMQGILNQYKAKIIRAIQQQWIVPVNANKNLSCVLLIRLAPGGDVLSVETLQSSGDAVLDRSARVAVFKASPLPVPKDSATFSEFRELRLTVRPLQIQS